MSNWLSIEFNQLGNAAFEGENMGLELARILRILAQKFENMTRAEFVNDDADGALKDINGNKVGYVSGNFEDDDEDEREFYYEVRRHTKWMPYHEIAKFVEDHCGIAAGLSTEQELVDAIVQAIKDGDTNLGALEDFANNQS